jgi:hypothetical protein
MMDDKTLQALTTLAAKLGTTAEYLWGVLLKQAPLTGAIDLLLTATWVIGAVMWCRFVVRKTTKPKATEDDRYPHADLDAEPAFFAWLSAVLVALLAGLVVSSGLATTMAALLNPEYWALKQILK